jgi:hypothetical protein
MKGVFTLGIYIAIGITGAAFGQSNVKTVKTVAVPITGSDHAKTVTAVPMTKPPATTDRGWAPSVMPDAAETVVISYGRGGRVDEHTMRFAAYRNRKTKVEVRGPCYSACTMVAIYVSKADMCIAQGAFFGFHAVRSLGKNEIMPAETAFLYRQYPEDIRGWIDRTGGHEHLPLDGFWIMHDSELWAIGYPKCAP